MGGGGRGKAGWGREEEFMLFVLVILVGIVGNHVKMQIPSQ